ncbi:MAG: hypothetical protein ACREUG_00265 [Steroidobacteraceae bacterium]
MVKNSKQNWTVGQQVKVGFLTLTVRAAIPSPGDYRPDSYLLSNAAGDKVYEFTPHMGLQRLELHEAAELLEQARQHAARVAADAMAQAARVAKVASLFAAEAA